MFSNNHISKEMFFSIIERRLFKYNEAIFGRNLGSVNIASSIVYNMQRMRSLDAQDNYIGKAFWGYGINTISDGVASHSHFDVEVIKKINELNKHHESYRNLLVLVFKVENDSLFVSTFSIDSCSAQVNSNINTKYDLRNFENARIITRNNKTIVEFIFKGVSLPISFQIEDVHFPQNLSGGALAKYYIDTIKKIADVVPAEKTAIIHPVPPDFISDFIGGIQKLQIQDVSAECIRKLKQENKKDESLFRFWFDVWFDAKGYSTTPESLKGNGRIDLKVTHQLISNKVIEFKGWWNADKEDVVDQLHGYLTDFEGDGYVFMINNTKGNIVEKYKDIIVNQNMKYINNSWEEIPFLPSAFKYYKSKHDFGYVKTVYHFIFSIY